ncbi:uncharacterized protein An04g07640, partial [Aspergillus niger]
MEEHRWSVSDIGRASDVAIPRDSGAERGSPITCPADVTARGERYEIINNRNSTLPSESSVNAGWGPPLSAITLPNSYMPADNSTADHTADAWYSMRSLHPSIPAPQAAGWPFKDKAEQPQYLTKSGAEDVSLSIPTIIPLQSPSWDPLAPVSAALPMTNFYHRSMHQEPSTPVPTTMNHHETKPSSFDDMGANSQDSSWNVKVPEDQ